MSETANHVTNVKTGVRKCSEADQSLVLSVAAIGMDSTVPAETLLSRAKIKWLMWDIF